VTVARRDHRGPTRNEMRTPAHVCFGSLPAVLHLPVITSGNPIEVKAFANLGKVYAT
jgi:hypothetical protein